MATISQLNTQFTYCLQSFTNDIKPSMVSSRWVDVIDFVVSAIEISSAEAPIIDKENSILEASFGENELQ